MNRTLANIIIDLVAVFLFLGMLATGYILRFPLPPGSNKTLILWGYTRHQWGDVHFWISLGLLVVLVIHLVLHWNWVVTVIGKRCHLVKSAHPSLILSGILTGSLVTLLIAVFAWAAQISVNEIARPMRGKHQGHNRVVEPYAVAPVQNSNNREEVGFLENIYPIFENNCLSCHGPQKQLANFRVDRKEDFFGSEGLRPPLILPKQSNISPLIAIVSGTRKDMPMANIHKLSDQDALKLKAWIDAGAEWNVKTDAEK